MGRPIHPGGQPAGDHQPHPRQPAGELPRDLASARGRVAAADNGQLWLREQERITAIRSLDDIAKFRVGVVSGDSGEDLARGKAESVAAFAVASLLALLAVLTLLIKSVVEWQFERDQKAAALLPPENPGR